MNMYFSKRGMEEDSDLLPIVGDIICSGSGDIHLVLLVVELDNGEVQCGTECLTDSTRDWYEFYGVEVNTVLSGGYHYILSEGEYGIVGFLTPLMLAKRKFLE